MEIDNFGFDGKRALVVGGATGMGAEAARIIKDLGADVTVMDYAPVTVPGVNVVKLDLRDRAAIDAAVDECGAPIHALLSCAGVAAGTPGIHLVNFIGQRHLIERLMAQGKMPDGSAIAMISSIAGMGWETRLPILLEYLSTPDYEAAVMWIESHPEEWNQPEMDYVWTKQAVCAYVASHALPFWKQGVRINAVLPGIIDTGLARANNWFDHDEDWRAAAGIDPPTPDKPAYPLVFLCSAAASHVNGATLTVDAGWIPSQMTGTFVGGFMAEMGD
jgi:NAD(P)-dependent dehydrogenase (short-subunit alcohol dehydrogenase family)